MSQVWVPGAPREPAPLGGGRPGRWARGVPLHSARARSGGASRSFFRPGVVGAGAGAALHVAAWAWGGGARPARPPVSQRVWGKERSVSLGIAENELQLNPFFIKLFYFSFFF